MASNTVTATDLLDVQVTILRFIVSILAFD